MQRMAAQASDMLNIILVVQHTVSLVIEILQLMMLARAIISWLPGLEDSRLADFLFTLTEWLIMPVRALFERFGWGRNMMIDLPFFVTYLLLVLLGAVL